MPSTENVIRVGHSAPATDWPDEISATAEPRRRSNQRLRGSFTVSGQVDRLAVSEREILIVDYKTNRPPPADAAGVPLAYRRQLALYRALLQAIYPGRPVRAFLLWTAVPLLMEIDAKILNNSMPYASAS